MPPPPVFEARLVKATMLTPSVRELVLERVDGSAMSFAPGQWVNVLFPPGVGVGVGVGAGASAGASAGAGVSVGVAAGLPPLKRSYSIASAPDGSPRFEITVTLVRDGPGSTWLHRVDAGTVLSLSGPQGFFTRPLETAAPSLMIATGTGITPLRSMMRAASTAKSEKPIWFLHGVRYEHDLLYERELRDAATTGVARYEPTLSQPADGWHGRSGYVQTHVRALWLELAARSGARPHAYICGLQRMVSSVRDLLRTELRADRDQVHSERYD
jgi:ferredoxin-NADP reductase